MKKIMIMVLFLSAALYAQQKPETKPFSYDAFRYYEENKIDKADAYLLSGIIPGLGFQNTGRGDLGRLFFVGSAGTLLCAFLIEEPAAQIAFLFTHLVLRFIEFSSLSSAVEYHNEILRISIKVKLSL